MADEQEMAEPTQAAQATPHPVLRRHIMDSITRKVAAKVLETIDAGLVKGLGKAEPGKMCVEAAVCYALGLEHSDDPKCVLPALRSLKIKLNDQNWSSNAARAKGLRRLGLAQLGSDGIDAREFGKRVAEVAIRKMVPIALRAAAAVQKKPEHRQKLLDAANKCEAEGTRASALEARAAADAAAAAYAAYAADAAAYAAAYAAYAAAYAAYAAAYAAYAAADAAAAYAAADAAAKRAARDKVRAAFAEDVVQVLIAMQAPGCRFLDLAPLEEAA